MRIVVRSEIQEHVEGDIEDSRERRVDCECGLCLGISSLRRHADFGLLQNLVFRYDVTKSDDGVGGEEGTFCLCTLWYAVLCDNFIIRFILSNTSTT